MKIAQKISEILKTLPASPGIYKFIDEEGKVIYIGKAKHLSKRIKQYFKEGYQHSSRTQHLVGKISNIETISVDSELEAMILEHNLIKQLKPRYNVIMKDDKNYVYIKITREDFPRIQIVRRPEKDNAKYIGPKTAAHKVKETFQVLKKIFPFRHCNLNIDLLQENPPKDGKIEHSVKVTNKVLKYPCIDYYIKRCVAPCIGACSIEEYRKIIENVENFLSGKADHILKNLHQEMQAYATARNFEKAAKMRDKIKKIEEILEVQKVQEDNQEDKDVINYCISQNRAYFNLFQIRSGKLIDQQNFILSSELLEEGENPEVLESFLNQYYELATEIPKQILLPHEVETSEEIAKFLSEKRTSKVALIIPQKGTKNKLLEMSLNNARIYADRHKPAWRQESELTIKAAEDLQKILNLPNPLKRIECYDISHLSGTETVGSMIVFEKGVPLSSHYRKFQLRTVQNKPDDYKSMTEVLIRRFSKIAMDLHHQDYLFRKAKKKDNPLIEEQFKLKIKKSDKDFYILEKNKKTIGFIALKQYSEKIAEISSTWINDEYRGQKLGYKLVKSAVKKTKAKRIYVSCKESSKEYYQLTGFEEINKTPQELENNYKKFLKKHKKITILVYDKAKHKEDGSFSKIPDLIVIDGGKGQLSIATKVLQDLKLEISCISLAKRLEEIYTPASNSPIILPEHNEALKLLQRARDEAHRFAISYNRKLRSKKFKK